MAHMSKKYALRTHRMSNTAHLRYSLFHLNCTRVQNFLHKRSLLILEKEVN